MAYIATLHIGYTKNLIYIYIHIYISYDIEKNKPNYQIF